MSDEREFYHLQELDDAAADWDIDPTPPAYPEWSIGNEAFRFIAYPRRRETRHSRPAGGVRPAKRMR